MSDPTLARARRGRPPRLRRDDVLDAAESIGLATFTVAQLAAALGVSEGALYHHFANRDAITAAVCARLFHAVDTALDAVETWQDYLEAVCAQVRQVCLAHDGFGRWLVAGAYDDASLKQFDRILHGITRRAPHLDTGTAYLVGSHAVACTVGLVTSGFVGAVPGTATPDDLDDQFRWMLRSLLRGMAGQLADGVTPPRHQTLGRSTATADADPTPTAEVSDRG